MRILACSIVLSLRAGTARGATLIVPSEQYTYLWEAMEAAQPGDTIRLLPGNHSAVNEVLKDDLVIAGAGSSKTFLRGSRDFVTAFKAENVHGVVIEGLTIFGGRGYRTSTTGSPIGGGALYCRGSEVLIRDCVIARSLVGGISTFPEGRGGAIYARDRSSLTLINCVLRDNCAQYGGAVYLSGYPTSSSLTMVDCVLESNYASRYGGALDLHGPGEMVFESCRIVGNTGEWGGGIYCYNARLIMNNCVVTNNLASGGEGGALRIGDCDFTATNCVIADNIVRDATTNGVIGGGAIYSTSGSLGLINCAVARNTILEIADEDLYRRGGGVFVDDVTTNIANCIFWGNTEDISYTTKARLDVSYCNIEDMFPGERITHLDPRFVDAENGEFRLRGDSPCIDRGTDDPAILPDTDAEGNPRILFGGTSERPDLGAYEYDPSIALRICTESLAGAIDDHEYRAELKATGGFGPYSWFPLSGNLPLGMELSGDGILSGTPGIPGTYDFTVLVATLQGQSQQRTYQLEVSGYGHWYVDAGAGTVGDGSSPGSAFSTIQEAVDAASEGDRVHVAPGDYAGPIDVHVPIDLIGPGADQATIDGGQAGSVVSFWLLPFGRISGFTIANGLADRGGGLFLYDSGIEITDCVVESNSANYLGGGIYANLSPAKIKDCVVRGNVSGLGTYYAVQAGGGIYSYFSPLEIDRCVIENNGVIQAGYPYWGGGLSLHGSHPTLRNCLIAKNYLDSPSSYKLGAGIFAMFGSPVFVNCTIADNYVEDTSFMYEVGGLGAAACWATVRNCILWGNGVDLLDARAEYSVVGTPPQWVEGPGNISLDPEFVDPASGDYRLRDTSLCIDAGHAPYIQGCETDLDGQLRVLNGLVDMGAYENPRHEFGRVVIAEQAGGVTLTWNSHPGESYAIEISTDILHWGAAANASSQGLYTTWYDSDTFLSGRFYRVLRMQR